MVSLLITNGGGHPVSKWAELTADTMVDLIEIRDGSESRQADIARRVKMDLRLKLFDLFMAHHEHICECEKEELASDAAARIEHAKMHGHSPDEHLADTLAKVEKLFAATPFKAHFAQEHVKSILRNILGQHSADVMHHEHLYHQDREAAAASKGD
jgi:hypothetical protein